MKKLKKSKILGSSLIICPVCGKRGFTVKQVLDEIPYFGEVLETFASCKYCGYKAHDILPLSEKKYPKTQEIKVSKLRDLEIRVVKGKYCSIEIPEIGLKVKPGPESESYISNIEGIIDRLISSLRKIAVVRKDKREAIEKEISKLEKAKEGKFKLTIVFKDATGQSAILKRVPKRKINK